MQINLALNYGSKNEIINSFKMIYKKKLKITEKSIERYLYTMNIPDPEILIRTGNTKRLSNFYYGKLHILKFFLKNYGQILQIKIIKNLI